MAILLPMDHIKEFLSLLRIFISIASTSFVALVAWVFIHFAALGVGELIAPACLLVWLVWVV